MEKMNVEEHLDEVLGIIEKPLKEIKRVEHVTPIVNGHDEDTDFQYARENLYNLIERGQDGLEEDMQNVKPITYVASKWAVVGMTKYLATYFADRGIRVNCLSPTGVWNERIPEHMVQRIASLNPMNRMAHIDEYKGPIVFLASEISSSEILGFS